MKRENKTQYALLGILTQYECTGYDIKKFIETSIGFFWSESFGQIYPNLKRLEKEGSISSQRRQDTKGSVKIIYAITEHGRKKLKAWLVRSAEPLAYRHEMLLKLFFGSQMQPREIKDHLARCGESNLALLKTYTQIEKDIAQYKSTSPDWLYWRMTLQYGILSAKMELEWAAYAAKLLQSSKNKKQRDKK
ncbi:MAG: PadR family transcriptional regulator [Turneriella sp.]